MRASDYDSVEECRRSGHRDHPVPCVTVGTPWVTVARYIRDVLVANRVVGVQSDR